MGRDNIIGVILLGFCIVVGAALIFSIATGYQFRYTGPAWVSTVLGIVFIGAVLYGLFTSFRRRWPDPRTGTGWRWPWSKDENDPPRT